MAGKDPFPDSAITEGSWASIGEGRELVPIGRAVLDWEPATGHYRLWAYHRDELRAAKDPLIGEPLTEGSWGSIGAGHRLLSLGGDHVLDWVPESGDYRVWVLDPHARGGADPFPHSPHAEGNWSGIRAGHTLVYLHNSRVLDWVPATGEYKIWEFDRSSTGDPFPGAPLAEGTWSGIGEGHELVYLGEDRLLDWEPATGRFRVWRHDPEARGTDPLPGDPLTEGEWASLQTGHRLLGLGGDEVLDWTPASGEYRVWRVDRSI
jgi:hypothetical protein